jgi:hypothetical protein
MAKIFAENGTVVKNEFRVNTITGYNQRPSYVTGLNNGNFVAIWDDDS